MLSAAAHTSCTVHNSAHHWHLLRNAPWAWNRRHASSSRCFVCWFPSLWPTMVPQKHCRWSKYIGIIFGKETQRRSPISQVPHSRGHPVGNLVSKAWTVSVICLRRRHGSDCRHYSAWGEMEPGRDWAARLSDAFGGARAFEMRV